MSQSNTAPVERIRLQYQLPAEFNSPLGAWQPNESTRFADDRARMEQQNHRELMAKAVIIRRRVQS